MTRADAPIRAAFVTIIPSPYQRDLFAALRRRPEVDLHVYYLDKAAADSPWPKPPLEPYEQVLRGATFAAAGAVVHVNRQAIPVGRYDVTVLSSYMSTTCQRLMRGALRRRKWLYWGERMRDQPPGLRRRVQETASGPLRRASGIVGIGSLAQQSYGERFPGPPLYNIPYYIDLAPYQRIERDGSRETVSFLFCGQMIERKGVDLLLEAFGRLIAEGLPARLILVGREAELPQFLSRHSPAVRDAVDFRGFQAPDQLAPHFADADVFILPSRHDGWGVVVNQALGAGLPILCTDAVGAAHDLIEPEVNGRIIATGSSEAIYEAMRHLITHRADVQAWGAASRRKSAEWTPEAGAARWVSVLQEVVGKR